MSVNWTIRRKAGGAVPADVPQKPVQTIDLEPGQLPDDPMARAVVRSELQEHLANWRRTGNGAHAWRAWRCARLLPEMPADVQRELFAYFDLASRGLVVAETPTGLAQSLRMSNASGARGEGNGAAPDQADDRYLMIRYRHLLQLNPNKAAAHRRLAQEFRAPTANAIKQRILRIERRGK